MAKGKKGTKGKKGKKGKKKRKLPLALKISRECAVESGVKPFKKWAKTDHKKVDACVAKKMARRKRK